MAVRSASLGGHHHSFPDLKSLMAAATPLRSGDVLARVAARSGEERVAAQGILADLPLATFLEEMVIPYETDEVTRLILEQHSPEAFAPIASMTVGEFRDHLLDPTVETEPLAAGLTPEMVAATSKLMRVSDLISVARRTTVTSALRSTIGLPGTMATRLQPNHPTDDPLGVTATIIDGLLLGSGDAVIGINPATDSPNQTITLLKLIEEIREKYQIPTQSCVLAHVTTSLEIMERGAPVDLVFQSIAGTQAANEGFGVTIDLLRQAHQAASELHRGTVGNNVMYFETGQGSALSADAHHGVDQQTLEARAYAVAREFSPLLVNTVVGFIGPEYLYDGKQIIRAGLEDLFCGKLLGLPMGVDVCYTNHAEADGDDTDVLLTLLGAAGVGFVICVPGGDDVMLHYQSLSFHRCPVRPSGARTASGPGIREVAGNNGSAERRRTGPRVGAEIADVCRTHRELEMTATIRDPFALLRSATRARVALGSGRRRPPDVPVYWNSRPPTPQPGMRCTRPSTGRCSTFRATDGDRGVQRGSRPDRVPAATRPGSRPRRGHGPDGRRRHLRRLSSWWPTALSPLAVHRHAAAMWSAALSGLDGWTAGPVVIARQARVALGRPDRRRPRARKPWSCWSGNARA